MLSLLKVFGRGILVTLLLPFIVLVWVLYALYCCGSFIYMFFKSLIDFFRGKDFSSEMPEDIESRRIVLESEKQNEQAKEMLNVMYQNVMNQPRPIYNPPTNQTNDINNPVQNSFEPQESPAQYEENNSEEYEESSIEDYGESDDDLRGN